MKQVWTTEMEIEDKKRKNLSVPSHFKRYTIQDRKIIVQQPMHISEVPGKSYDESQNAKRIDLAEEGEEPRPTYIAIDLKPIFMDLVVGLPHTTHGYDAIWVIVDYLSKMCWLIPTTTMVTTPKLVTLFVKNIYRLCSC